METMTPEQIKSIRKQLGWSVEKIALFMNMGENAVRKWECGLRAVRGPAIVLYRQLAKRAAKHQS